MKYFTFGLLFIGFLPSTSAQIPVWNIQPPVVLATPISLQLRGDHFLLYGQKTIVEFDQLGIITAWKKEPFSPGYGSFFREKTDALTGEPYFLVSSSKNGGPTGLQLRISEYHPGQGYKNEKILPESGGGFSAYPVISRNDSILFILGKKYLRQITHHTDHSVVVNWEKTHTLGEPVAAVFTTTGMVGISTHQIFALDSLGNTLWIKPVSYGLKHITKIQNGFLVCGRDASVTPYVAKLIKFTADGTVVWNKTFPDQIYKYLLAEPDGSMTVTGQSAAGSITLHHLDQNGITLWQKSYQSGMGNTLLRTPDGGYLIAGSSNSALVVIKTDGSGNTSPLRTDVYPTWGEVENSLLSSKISPASNLFQGNYNEASAFLLPKDDSTSLFLLAAPWMSGLDATDSLHLAADTYIHPMYGSDFRAGFSHTSPADLQRVWTIRRTEIDNLQQDWQDNGAIDAIIPYDVLTWPARGNADLKQNLNFTKTTIDKNLLSAPFVDRNGDGKYSIYDGDYPRMKGDQMGWWVMTDSTFHYNTFGRPFIMDLSVSAYAFDCPLQEKLKRSLFVDFEYINRSGTEYKNMFAGLWTLPGLGCPADDYIGSLPAVDAFYVYNQDSIDGHTGTNCYYSSNSNFPTFGNHAPIASVSFSNVKLSKFIYYYSSDVQPAPPAGRTKPKTAEEYNHYLQGKWADGTTPVYEGQPIEYAYDGNPVDPNANSMCQYGSNPIAGGRYMIGSHGPFNFAPNDTFQLQVAFTYHPDIPLPCPDISGAVQNDLEELHDLIQSGALDPPANLPASIHLPTGQTVLLDATVPGATAYAWSNGATSPVTSVNQPGIYTVTITPVTGCTSVEMVAVQGPTATETPAWLDHVRIFPNPTAGPFHLEVRGGAHEVLELTLFNALGQAVQQQVVDFGSGVLNQTVDCPHLPAGIYSLRLRAGEKTRHVKVILQR